MERFTPLANIIHCRWHCRQWQISSRITGIMCITCIACITCITCTTSTTWFTWKSEKYQSLTDWSTDKLKSRDARASKKKWIELLIWDSIYWKLSTPSSKREVWRESHIFDRMDIFWILRKGKDASDLVAVSFVDYIKNLYLRMLFWNDILQILIFVLFLYLIQDL